MSLDITDLKLPRKKSVYLALFLTLLFGPLGLRYLSWKRAAVSLLLFVVSVYFFPCEALVVVGLRLILPASFVLTSCMAPRRSGAPFSADHGDEQAVPSNTSDESGQPDASNLDRGAVSQPKP